MLKLLIAIDGSEGADRALDYALRLAKEGEIELAVLNVRADPVVYGEIQVYVPVDRLIELEVQRSEALLAPAVEKIRSADVRYTSEVEPGDAATVIARRAETLGCDGIVMGTRGMGPISNLLLGSVAAKVVHLATVPVTLVK